MPTEHQGYLLRVIRDPKWCIAILASWDNRFLEAVSKTYSLYPRKNLYEKESPRMIPFLLIAFCNPSPPINRTTIDPFEFSSSVDIIKVKGFIVKKNGKGGLVYGGRDHGAAAGID